MAKWVTVNGLPSGSLSGVPPPPVITLPLAGVLVGTESDVIRGYRRRVGHVVKRQGRSVGGRAVANGVGGTGTGPA